MPRTTSKPSAPNAISERTGPEILIELYGPVPSKKNRYMPRRDRPGMFKCSALERQLDSLALQIPPELCGLELENPDIELYVECPDMRRDRDNILTTILDVLVRMRVIRDDSMSHLNGFIVIHPARRAAEWKTVVVLRPNQDAASETA